MTASRMKVERLRTPVSLTSAFVQLSNPASLHHTSWFLDSPTIDDCSYVMASESSLDYRRGKHAARSPKNHLKEDHSGIRRRRYGRSSSWSERVPRWQSRRRCNNRGRREVRAFESKGKGSKRESARLSGGRKRRRCRKRARERKKRAIARMRQRVELLNLAGNLQASQGTTRGANFVGANSGALLGGAPIGEPVEAKSKPQNTAQDETQPGSRVDLCHTYVLKIWGEGASRKFKKSVEAHSSSEAGAPGVAGRGLEKALADTLRELIPPSNLYANASSGVSAPIVPAIPPCASSTLYIDKLIKLYENALEVFYGEVGKYLFGHLLANYFFRVSDSDPVEPAALDVAEYFTETIRRLLRVSAPRSTAPLGIPMLSIDGYRCGQKNLFGGSPINKLIKLYEDALCNIFGREEPRTLFRNLRKAHLDAEGLPGETAEELKELFKRTLAVILDRPKFPRHQYRTPGRIPDSLTSDPPWATTQPLESEATQSSFVIRLQRFFRNRIREAFSKEKDPPKLDDTLRGLWGSVGVDTFARILSEHSRELQGLRVQERVRYERILFEEALRELIGLKSDSHIIDFWIRTPTVAGSTGVASCDMSEPIP